jgi:tripartite-type tricarboxylate transporter receptor subunit TctC
MNTRREFLLFNFALAATPAFADTYPSRPITLIVPFPAGSGTDTATRAMVQVLQATLKTPIVVDTRPGGNGIIGAQAAARQKSDGYSLLVGGTGTHAANPILYRQIGYDPLTDFVPVASTIVSAPVLFAGPSTSVRSVQELLQLSRARPGSLNFAAGNAAALFTAELLKQHEQLQFTIVRYVSPPQAHLDLATGRVDFMFGDFGAGQALMQAGKLRPLAVAAPQRMATYQEVPTMAQAGVPGVECELWNGIFAPRGMSLKIVHKLNEAIALALRDEDVIATVNKAGQDPRISMPAQFASYVQAEYQHWQEMARLIHYQPE